MAELWLIRKMDMLVPANEQTLDALRKLKPGQWYRADIKMPRNVKFHRKYFALLGAVFPHQTMWPTFRKFRAKFEEALGHGEYHVNARGERYFENESISFASMEEDEFEQLYERAVELILTRILPGVGRAELDQQVAEIMEGRRADA
jgi:hypothetical protein